jgi:hypothetical protein
MVLKVHLMVLELPSSSFYGALNSFGIFQVLNRIFKHTSKFYGFKPVAALCAINLSTFLLN